MYVFPFLSFLPSLPFSVSLFYVYLSFFFPFLSFPLSFFPLSFLTSHSLSLSQAISPCWAIPCFKLFLSFTNNFSTWDPCSSFFQLLPKLSKINVLSNSFSFEIHRSQKHSFWERPKGPPSLMMQIHKTICRYKVRLSATKSCRNSAEESVLLQQPTQDCCW